MTTDVSREYIDKVLGRIGWRFVGTRMAGPVVVEYTIERISDKRYVTCARPIHEIINNTMVSNTIDLPVSFTLLTLLYIEAQRTNKKDGVTPATPVSGTP